MLEYLPWSSSVLTDSLLEYKKGKFTILDIDLGGECNFTCIYCDSPDRQRKCTISISNIERFLKSRQFKWVHICGLGEPTFANNYELLIAILKMCEAYGVKCNMFSNIFNFTDELVEYVEKEILYILFKIDTLNDTYAANLYGIDSGKAQHQIENIKKLTKLVKIRDGCTNLAASLVPTNINLPVIVPLIESMYSSNIFPMIGDLENSGRGREHFDALNLSNKKLKQLKRDINSIIGAEYTVPQCPAVISSIHISADNNVIVDEYSGLSCSWFWLEEPRLKTLFQFTGDLSLEATTKMLLQYRQSRLDGVENWLIQQKEHSTIFGGCGGDIEALLEVYLDTQRGVTYKYGDLS